MGYSRAEVSESYVYPGLENRELRGTRHWSERARAKVAVAASAVDFPRKLRRVSMVSFLQNVNCTETWLRCQ